MTAPPTRMTAADATALAWVRQACVSGQARGIREAARLSATEVARTCETDPSTISRWEACLRTPTGRPALAYARLLQRLERAGQQ